MEIPRRQYYCNNCQKYFTEQLCFVDEGRRYTQRYEEYIYHRVQVTTVEQVKREEELSWDQVQGIFNHIEVREQVSEVSVDMWGGFPKVIQEVFPNAIVVYDRFHVMKYGSPGFVVKTVFKDTKLA